MAFVPYVVEIWSLEAQSLEPSYSESSSHCGFGAWRNIAKMDYKLNSLRGLYRGLYRGLL